MNLILGIDPGMSTGLVWGQYDNLTPFLRLGYKQITGGLEGLKRWFTSINTGIDMLSVYDQVIVERFTPRPQAHTYKLDELEPLRIEGWLSGLPNVIWRDPGKRALLRAGVDETEALLRSKGLLLTGSDVGAKDADDVNSAQMHIYAYLRSIGHRPTLDTLLA